MGVGCNATDGQSIKIIKKGKMKILFEREGHG